MPKKNKLDDLRDHLFETLEALRDDEKPMDLARAEQIADVAKVIVESAKVEVVYLKVTGALKSTDFFPDEQHDARRALNAKPATPATVKPS